MRGVNGFLISLFLAGTWMGTAPSRVQARGLPPTFQAESQQLKALMIEFGIRDHESTPWDGSVTLSGGASSFGAITLPPSIALTGIPGRPAALPGRPHTR